MENNRIDSFQGEYAFLNNMYENPLTFDGVQYRNAEAAIQAQKCRNKKDCGLFGDLDAVGAITLVRELALRKDWDEVRLQVMEDVVRIKFTQSENLAERLLMTGDKELVHGNNRNDTYWGCDTLTGYGENHLGRILMKIRSELLSERTKQDKTVPLAESSVHCGDCRFLRVSGAYGECGKTCRGIVNANDSCGKGAPRESGSTKDAPQGSPDIMRALLICYDEDGLSFEKYPSADKAKSTMVEEMEEQLEEYAEDDEEDEDDYPENDTTKWIVIDFTAEIDAAVAATAAALVKSKE